MLVPTTPIWNAGPCTPLTVCLLVGGRHLPGLGFMNVLLSSQAVLDPPTRLYQRLIAGDVEEAVELAEAHVAGNSLPQFYDEVGITDAAPCDGG